MTDQQTTTDPTANAAAGGRVQALVVRPLAWVWEQIKLPFGFVMLSFLMGFGFYHGFMAAVDWPAITADKVLVVRIVDLSDKSE